MAKPLVVKFGGAEIPFAMSKVERSDLYGSIEIETLDEKGRRCTLATLADDGRSVITSGGTALITLSPQGEWLEKKSLVPTDHQGNPITPVPSSYASALPLDKTVTIDEYLTHDIRAVYQVSSEADCQPLLESLKKGTIYHFPYSFRGGLEPDAGFLLMAADGTPFIAIGSPTKLEFVSFEQTAAITGDEDTGDEDDDALDFSMM